MPPTRASPSPSPEARSGGEPYGRPSKRHHRACQYCRDHRIKCDFQSADDTCKRCGDLAIPCDRTQPPPKDRRPRRRTLFRTNTGAVGLGTGQGIEATYLGNSSLAFLVWQVVPQTADLLDRLRVIDDKHDIHRGSIGGVGQDGLLLGQEEAELRQPKPQLMSVSMVQTRLAQEFGQESVLQSLYETCRDRVIPFFPIISVSESLLDSKPSETHVDKYAVLDPRSTPPTPLPRIVRLVHCAIAARDRSVPARVGASLLAAIHSLLGGPELSKLMATRCLGSVQVLLLLSMCDELNGVDSLIASENVWQNVGHAIRMGFALGLHRNISSSHVPYSQLNRRLRIWGACITMDRWCALRTGRTMAIDVADCDAPLPRHYADGIREGDTANRAEPIFPCFRFHSELTSLSLLLGRVSRLVGTPSGLQHADDMSLLLLQVNIDSWMAALPTNWPYSIKLTLRQAPALMNLLSIALERRFHWPVTPIPLNITYRPTRERWLNLCQRAEQAVYWLSTPDGTFYLDTWSLCVYPAFCCVIIHFKAFEELKDPHHRWLLQRADDVFQDWAAQLPTCVKRARFAAMSALLRSIADTAPLAGAWDTMGVGAAPGAAVGAFPDSLQAPLGAPIEPDLSSNVLLEALGVAEGDFQYWQV